jgi:hypothetical protein
MDESKEKIISSVYYDPAGYGSIATTYRDSKKRNKDINLEDVKLWYKLNIQQKTNYKKYNSWIADKVYQEYQADLFFINGDDLEYKVGLIVVDAFSKYCVVIPIKSKLIPDVLQGFKDAFKKMGRLPESVYSDMEGSFVSNEVKKYFADNNIKSITTLTHAAIVERTILTIKMMITKRQEKEYKPWYEYLFPVLLTYNNKMVHSSTKFTPVEARRPINSIAVKINLERLRKSDRKYEALEIGDTVRYFRKKDKLDKQHISTWSTNKYEIEEIINQNNQTFYKTSAPHHDKLYLRHELLKVHT